MPNPFRNPHIKAIAAVAVVIIGALAIWAILRFACPVSRQTVQWLSYCSAFLGTAAGSVGATTLFATRGTKQSVVDFAEGAEVKKALESTPDLEDPMTRAAAKALRDALDRQEAAQKTLTSHSKARDWWSLAGWTLVGWGAGLSFFTQWWWPAG